MPCNRDLAAPRCSYLEKVVHPRWPRTFEVAKRGVGFMILRLTVVLLLTPIPSQRIFKANGQSPSPQEGGESTEFAAL